MREPPLDPARSRKYALVAATAASFLTPFMGSSVNIALPSMAADFAMDAISLSWVASAFILSATICMLPFGKIADIHGRRRVFLWGILAFTAASLLAGLARSGLTLIAFRALQGIASAMIFSTGMAILTSIFPQSERGRVLGINVAAVYLGLSLGPTVGGLLTTHFGWRSIFLSMVPLGLIVSTMVHRNLRGEWAEAKGERLDLRGCLVYGVMLAAMMFGLSELPALRGVALLVAGVLCGVLFVWWEGRVDNPVLDIRLFRYNRVFAFSNAAALVHYSATFAVGFLLSLYLQYLKGLAPQAAGTVLVVQPIVMALFSPFAGTLSDRIEPRVVASIGMGLTAVGLIAFIFLDAETSLAFTVAALILIGFGFALFSSPNSNAIMSAVAKRSYGVASATLGTMRLVGQMFSMGLVMVIFTTMIGRVQIRPEAYPLFMRSAKIAFVIFSGLCLLGIFASLVRGRVRAEGERAVG